MRSVAVVAFLAACLPLAGSAAASGAREVAAQPRIVIGEQSNVCVTVHVDQRIWPTPLDADSARNFSGFFASELARLHRERGGSSHLPGPRQIPRFVANPGGTTPQCRDIGQDIDVVVRYAPRPDGRPFVVDYRIVQGAIVRAGSFSRDIEEEWRSGRLVRIHKTEPLQIAVTDDIRARAPMIADQLLVGEP